MQKLHPFIPAFVFGVVVILVPFLSQTIESAFASLASSIVCLLILGYAVYVGAIPKWRSWAVSHFLLIAFAAAILLSTLFSQNSVLAGFGFALGMTSGFFLVLISILALVVGALETRSRRALFAVGSVSLCLLLLSPLYRSEVSVRPSFEVTSSIASSLYADSGMKAILLGHGPGSFVYAWQAYKPKAVLSTSFWSDDFSTGNSVISTVFIEAGVIAGLLFIVIFLVAIAEEMPRLFARGLLLRNRAERILRVTALLLAFGSLLFIEPSAVLILTCAIILGSVKVEVLDGVSLSMWVRRVVLGVVALVLLGIVYLCVSVGFYFYAFFAVVRGDLLFARSYAEYAHRIVPHPQTSRLLVQILRTTGHELGRINSRQEAIQKVFSLASTYSRESTIQEPKNVQNWKLLGITLAEELALAKKKEFFDEGKRAFAQAKQLAPSDPAVLFFEAQLHILAGEKDRATQLLDEALLLRPSYTEARELRDAAR